MRYGSALLYPENKTSFIDSCLHSAFSYNNFYRWSIVVGACCFCGNSLLHNALDDRWGRLRYQFRATVGQLEGQRVVGAIGTATGVVKLLSTTVSPPSYYNSSNSVPSPSPIIEELKYLPSGPKVILLDPTPSQLSRSRSLYLAFAEHLIWYPAL